MKKYIIVSVKILGGQYVSELQNSVNKWMDKGYVPSGGLLRTDGYLLQPMVKENPCEL